MVTLRKLILLFLSFLLISTALLPACYGGASTYTKESAADDDLNIISDDNNEGAMNDRSYDIFRIKGLLLLSAWAFLFLKPAPRILGVGIVSALTSRWQQYGHENGFLPTNDTEPFDEDGMYTMFLYDLSILSMLCRVFRGRSLVIVAFMFHVWLERGYRMGYI